MDVIKGKEIKNTNEKGLELVVHTLAQTVTGRQVLQFFIHEGMGASFTTDPIMNSWLEGKRSWGRKMFTYVVKNHAELVDEILGSNNAN